MKDIYIGSNENENTGVSVVLAPQGARGGVCVRGGAPGTRETELLGNGRSMETVHAVVLTGGSAFGLASCDGVMRYLREQGAGVKVGFHTVPLVAGAVIFDLNAPELRYPDAVMGYKACAAAVPLRDGEGRYAAAERFSGAGRGATVGKIAGPERCQRGGIGLAVVKAGGAEIAALTVVNALGDVFDCETGKIVAGARAENGFWDANKWILSGQFTNAPEAGRNTTIGAIVTDANLTKAQCNRLAEVAHDGLALAIRPVHTGMDGDALFVLSAGEKEADFNALCVAAVEAVRLSILNAVRA